MGAAMLAAYGSGWFASLSECAEAFIRTAEVYKPNAQQAEVYDGLFHLYQQVYGQTRELNDKLAAYRK
ncbi:Xylulose kinase [compost metagenome]